MSAVTGDRLRQGLAAVAFRSQVYSFLLGRAAPDRLAFAPTDPWPGDAARGQEIVNGVWRLAGESWEGEAAPWSERSLAPPFLAALHSFGWLRDLRALGGDSARRRARTLIADWIDRHDQWDPVAWRAETLGARAAAWLAAHEFCCASADNGFRRRVFQSLSRQLRHLGRTLPGGLDGQPLVVALKGMIIGAVTLNLPRQRLTEALDLLEDALPRQVLADGGTVERNPSILLGTLCHLIDIRAALRAAHAPMPEAVQHAIDRMAPALRFFRHGDGGMGLFNGSAAGEPVLIDTALNQADARGRPLRSAVQSGYERALRGRTLVLMDVGGPPPRGVDGSATAGLLAFEMSVGRERVIVNCGAWPGGGKAEEDWRQALRATAAHSTLTLADTNALALVPDGGVVRRGQPLRDLMEVERHEIDDAVLIEAAHDGYRHGFGLTHKRRLYLAESGEDVRGEDLLDPETGSHRGGLRFAVRFHLHPTVKALMVGGGDGAILRLPGGAGWRFWAEGGELTLEDSPYLGDGLPPRRSAQLVVSAATEARGATVKWALRRERKS